MSEVRVCSIQTLFEVLEEGDYNEDDDVVEMAIQRQNEKIGNKSRKV